MAIFKTEKKLFLIIFFIFSLIQISNAQGKNMKIFDITNFEKNRNELMEYNYSLKDGTKINQEKKSDGTYRMITQKFNSTYKNIYFYDQNGRLEKMIEVLIQIKLIIRIYDVNGNIIHEETPPEAMHPFSLADLKSLLKTRFKLNIEDSRDIKMLGVLIHPTSKKTTYEIWAVDGNNRAITQKLSIDVLTGKILKEIKPIYNVD